MKYSLWVHAKNRDGATVQQRVIESGFFGTDQAAIDDLHQTAFRLVQHSDISEVNYKIFKETSLTPVTSGVLHSVSVSDKKGENKDA